MLQLGDSIPQFEAHDADGNVLTRDDLLGSITVIYFYPKDDTPGCTKEACDFRDRMMELDGRGILVLGVSPDTASSHANFAEKYDLNFPLIVDEKKELARRFGVLKEKTLYGKPVIGIERTTYIVDEKGFIRWLERPVQVEGHIQRVMRALDDLQLGVNTKKEPS